MVRVSSAAVIDFLPLLSLWSSHPFSGASVRHYSTRPSGCRLHRISIPYTQIELGDTKKTSSDKAGGDAKRYEGVTEERVNPFRYAQRG
jgi:hypothetical protein